MDYLKRFVILAVAVFILTVASVTPESIQKQTAETASHNQDGQTKKGDSQPQPAPTLKPEQTVKLQSPPTEERNESIYKENSEPDWWTRICNGLMVIGTLALAVIGGIAACIALKTLKHIAKQTKHAGIAAKAARDTAQAVLNSDRPWLLVCMKEGDKFLDISDPVLFPRLAGEFRNSYSEFAAKNYGKTPAQVVAQKFFLIVGNDLDKIPDPVAYEIVGAVPENYPFPPGEKRFPQASFEPDGKIAADDYAKVLAREKHVWLCGYFKYVDTFDRPNPPIYETRVAFRWIYQAMDQLDRDKRINYWTLAGEREYNTAK